jgi:transposase
MVMDDPRDHLLESAPGTDLGEVLTQLRSDVATLLGDVARLRHENLDLRQQAGYWKAMHAAATERLDALRQEVEQLRGENRQLHSDLFGRRSEKPTVLDRSNELDDPQDPKPVRRRGQQPHQAGPKRRDYGHLPVRQEWVDLPASQRRGSCGGQPWTACGTADSEHIEIETHVYRRVIHRRRYQRTCTCPGPLTRTAPAPAKLIPKSRFGVSVWVDVLLDKFASQRPTERLLQAWRMLDFDVAAGTVTEGLRRIAPLLQGVYDAICERNRLSTVFQADETRWKVFEARDGKTNHAWWLWVFGGADTVVYVLDVSRSHDAPHAHLGEAEGVLVVDRYSAYKAMPGVKTGQLKLAFCWAHVRRDFVRVGKGWPELKEWALAWLRRIRALYRLNRQRGPAATNALRQAELRDAVARIRGQSQVEQADPHVRAEVRKVLTSLDEHWAGLTRFVEDPRIPMDNNLSERRLRGAALGRKNYYGSQSVWSGQLAAMMFTLVATLGRWRINPRRWLLAWLQQCAEGGGRAPADGSALWPWNLTPETLAMLREGGGSPEPESG